MTRKLLKYQPYAGGRRPSRAKWTDFIVDGLSHEILGVRDPVHCCCRPVGSPDSPDEEIGEALCAVVKGWA